MVQWQGRPAYGPFERTEPVVGDYPDSSDSENFTGFFSGFVDLRLILYYGGVYWSNYSDYA